MNIGMMRRRIAVNALPYDAEVEYIEKRNDTSTKSSPILVLNPFPVDERTDCFELCFQNTKNVVAQDRYIMSNNNCMHFYANANRNYAIYLNGAWQYFYTIVIDNNKHYVKVDYKNGKGYVDNVQRKTWTGGSSNVQGDNLSILPQVNYVRFFYFKFWKNGELIRDLRPVRKGNVGYLFDIVNEVLYSILAVRNTYILGPDK